VKRLSRRWLLRGAAGVALALPALESLRAHAGPTVVPKRFIGVYHANGVFTPDWFPRNVTAETTFDLGPTHAALAPFRSKLLWTHGVDLAVALTGPGEQHQRGLGALLTGQRLGEGLFVGNDGTHAGWAQGASIDQALVPLIGLGTRVPSLQLGVHTIERDVSGALSYAGADQPLLSVNDPAQVFHQLFLDGSGAASGADRLKQQRGSVLDGVQAQLAAMSKRVSKADAARLDRHLTLLRELEVRVTQLPPGTCVAPPEPGTMSYDTEGEMPDVTGLMIDLIVAAFRCDLTRVVTLSISDAKNHMAMPFINVASDIHNISHYADGDPMRADLGKRDVWVTQKVADLLTKLSQAQEADGSTLLDDTLVFWGSDVSRGNVHAHDDMPFVLAGGGAGFRMGRVLQYSSRPHNDLLLAILQAFGSTASSFGDPTACIGPLPNLY
jgi:hypothetical protein